MKPNPRSLAEWFARQLRWREPIASLWARRAYNRSAPSQVLTRAQFETTLSGARLTKDDVLLVHASTTNVTLREADGEIRGPETVACRMLTWLRDAVGPNVTLVMPTYPLYREVRAFAQPMGVRRLTYNPSRNFSKTGLLSEAFRRLPGALRSPIPLQSLAAQGPRAYDLIRPDLVPDGLPPHGKGTPHHRLCEANALVIGIGLPLNRYLTLVHVAEDLRFELNRARGFYRPRLFTVISDGQHDVTVWERRPEFARVFCSLTFHRDIVRCGVLQEGSNGTFDRTRAGELLAFLQKMTHSGSTYPYLLPSLAGPFAE
jgi:aminoglycoside N3'-acetyltransferase